MSKERQSASLLEAGSSQGQMTNNATTPLETRTQRVWFYRAGHGDTPLQSTISITAEGLTQLMGDEQLGTLSLAQLLGTNNLNRSADGIANVANPSASVSDPLDPGASPLEAQEEDGAWWLDIESPTDAELSELSEVIRMHPLTEEDIKAKEPRDLCQRFPNHLSISFQSVTCCGSQAPLAKPIYLLVFPKGTVSIHYGATYDFKETVERIKFLGQSIKPSSTWVACVLLNAIANAFVLSTVNISSQRMYIKNEVSRGNVVHSPTLINNCRQQVADLLLMGLKSSKETVVKSVSDSECDKGDLSYYVSGVLVDTLDKLKTTCEKLQEHDRVLQQLLDHVSSKKTDLINRKMLALTWVMTFAIAFLSVNVITGLMGMNVTVPGQPEDDEKHSNYGPFFGIIGVIILYACLMTFGVEWLVQRFTNVRLGAERLEPDITT